MQVAKMKSEPGEFLCLFIHSLIQQIFIRHLLCTGGDLGVASGASPDAHNHSRAWVIGRRMGEVGSGN